MTTTPDDETGDEPSVHTTVLALPEAADVPAASEWELLVVGAGPAADNQDDELDTVLEGIVIPAPAVRPDPRLPVGDPVEIPATVIRTVPAPAPPTPATPPVPQAPQAPQAPQVPPVPPRPPQVPTVGGGHDSGSGTVPPPAADPADAEPEQQAEPDVPEPEDVTPPAWWTSPARRSAADRVAWEIGGDHAAKAATRIAPLFDLPEADPDTKPEKKPTEAERAKARDAASAERRRRFRRWCTLTVLSAGVGAELRLPQAMGAAISGAWETGGQWTGTGFAGFLVAITWSVDWYLRGGTREQGATRIGDVRLRRLPLLVVVRVPFASALVAGLGGEGLLAAATQGAHHLFS